MSTALLEEKHATTSLPIARDPFHSAVFGSSVTALLQQYAGRCLDSPSQAADGEAVMSVTNGEEVRHYAVPAESYDGYFSIALIATLCNETGRPWSGADQRVSER